MTWLSWGAIKLLLGGWLKRLTAALSALLSWARHNPWPAITIALCALSLFIWWHYSGKVESLTSKLSTANQAIGKMKDASEQNRLAQLAQKARVEQHYKELANEADLKHDAQLADANDAVARYISTHRVRPASPGGGFSPASGAPESGNSQGTERPGSETLMAAVSDDDLRICTVNTTRLQAAHDWAMKLSTPSD